MSESIQSEFAKIKLLQNRLRVDMEGLDSRIQSVENALLKSSTDASAIPPIDAPSPTPLDSLSEAAGSPIEIKDLKSNEKVVEKPAPRMTEVRTPDEESRSEGDKPSIEMAVGLFWFVRIGIVILITGLGFLGHYTYQNVVSNLGPAGKLSLMYFGVFTMLGAGLWLERRALDEKMRHYARVLVAGGFAAGYFTSYAAHHIENLRLISSPLWGGMLLLAWAGSMMGWSHRRKIESVATLGVCLAIYASIFSHPGLFTLVSNLLLAASAAWLMVKNRWHRLTHVSLMGAYGAYAYWRVLGPVGIDPFPEAWSLAFLLSYWVIFLVAGVVSVRAEGYSARTHRFLAMNNAGAFGLMYLTLNQAQPDQLWLLALISGLVLILLAIGFRRVIVNQPVLSQSTLVQGLLLTTLGLGLKWSGNELVLVYAIKSVILCALAVPMRDRIQLLASWVIAMLATLIALATWEVPWLMVCMSMIGFGLNAVWTHQWSRQEGDKHLQTITSLFWVLSWVNGIHWLRLTLPLSDLPLGIICLTWVGLGVNLRFRMRVDVFTSIIMVSGAAFLWVVMNSGFQRGEFHPVTFFPLLISQFAFAYLIRRGVRIDFSPEELRIGLTLFAVNVVAMLHVASQAYMNPGLVLLSTGVFALVLTIYGVVSKWKELALIAQFFVLSGVIESWRAMNQGAYEMWPALSPIAAMWYLFLPGLNEVQMESKRRHALQIVQTIYGGMALVLSMIWMHHHVVEWLQPALLGGWGLLLLHVTGKGHFALKPLVTHSWVVFSVLTYAWTGIGDPSANPLALLLCGSLIWGERIQHKWIGTEERGWNRSRLLWAGAACFCFWLYASRLAQYLSSGFLITLGWMMAGSLILVFGLAIKERPYRWSGFIIIGAGLARVFFYDVWQLSLGYRIVTLIVTGTAFLVLGYIYNRNHERMKQWL